MLKKSSRPVSSKQTALMADPFSLPSPNGNGYHKTPNSPLFPLSPRVLVGLSPKGYADVDAAMSPTSILEAKAFTPTVAAKPFFSERNPRKIAAELTPEAKLQHHHQQQPVGLGIVDSLKKPAKPEGSRMVIFGSQLKIQIPSARQTGFVDCVQSPIEFGTKNRDAQLALLSPAARQSPLPDSLVTGCLSQSEMEMSEDYTCVIAHGPNPRTTHIFDNFVLESCGDGFAPATPREGYAVLTPRKESKVSDDFLNCCHACKKRLGQGKDIFMYRGDKAFCSRDCRYQEMLFDEGMEDCSPPDPSATL